MDASWLDATVNQQPELSILLLGLASLVVIVSIAIAADVFVGRAERERAGIGRESHR